MQTPSLQSTQPPPSLHKHNVIHIIFLLRRISLNRLTTIERERHELRLYTLINNTLNHDPHNSLPLHVFPCITQQTKAMACLLSQTVGSLSIHTGQSSSQKFRKVIKYKDDIQWSHDINFAAVFSTAHLASFNYNAQNEWAGICVTGNNGRQSPIKIENDKGIKGKSILTAFFTATKMYSLCSRMSKLFHTKS